MNRIKSLHRLIEALKNERQKILPVLTNPYLGGGLALGDGLPSFLTSRLASIEAELNFYEAILEEWSAPEEWSGPKD